MMEFFGVLGILILMVSAIIGLMGTVVAHTEGGIQQTCDEVTHTCDPRYTKTANALIFGGMYWIRAWVRIAWVITFPIVWLLGKIFIAPKNDGCEEKSDD